MTSFNFSVVPAIIVLTCLHLPIICGDNNQQIEFGTRVEQAKNLCTNRRTCRFGYTFNSDRDLTSSESRNIKTNKRKTNANDNEKIGRRRVPRVRIDPRRRRPEQEKIVEEPVTIKIGGIPIVIPDFDLTPATTRAEDQAKLVESTLKKPEAGKKRRRNRVQTKRKKNDSQSKIRMINVKATPAPKTTVTKSRPSTRGSTRSSKQSTTSSPATAPVTGPVTGPVLNTNTQLTTLTSFDSLQETAQNAANNVKLSTIFTTLHFNRKTTAIPSMTTSQLNTTNRPRLFHRGRITKKQRQQTPTITSTTERYQTKECPESLEKCVDACVPLQDIYAYSACVVECGERCPVILD